MKQTITLLALVAASAHGLASDGFCGGLSGPTTCATTDDVFLRTTKIELGIHPSQSFGTQTPAPASFAYSSFCTNPAVMPHHKNCQLGFICDFADDGLLVGDPAFSGDYFVPGSPVEGWTLQYTRADTSIAKFTNAGLSGRFEVLPTSISITSDDTTNQQSVWTGTTGDVNVRSTTTIPYNKKLFYVHTCITNIGTTNLKDLYYMRNIDPDQQQPWNGNFQTYNYVQYQPSSFGYPSYVNPAVPNMAAVLSRGDTGVYSQFVLALGAVDPRAFASHGGFFNTDPAYYYNNDAHWQSFGGAGVTLADTASMSYQDEGINLVFKENVLEPGQETCFRTYFGLSTDFLGEIVAVEGCLDNDGRVTCDTVQDLGLCDVLIPGETAPLSSICPLSCGCCNIGGVCRCDDNDAVAEALNCFHIKGVSCKRLAKVFGCRHKWLGAFLRRHCPCTCQRFITVDPAPTSPMAA